MCDPNELNARGASRATCSAAASAEQQPTKRKREESPPQDTPRSKIPRTGIVDRLLDGYGSEDDDESCDGTCTSQDTDSSTDGEDDTSDSGDDAAEETNCVYSKNPAAALQVPEAIRSTRIIGPALMRLFASADEPEDNRRLAAKVYRKWFCRP